MAGTLYLVPNLLGLVAPEAVLPQRTIDIARTARPLGRRNAEGRTRVPEVARRAASDRRARHCAARRRTSRACRRPALLAAARRGPRRRPAVGRRLSRRRRSWRALVAAAHARGRARRAAGGSVGDPARADGVGDERPAVRVSWLPAGQARGARETRCARSSSSRARASAREICSSRRPIAMPRCFARCAQTLSARTLRLRRRRPDACRRSRSSAARRRNGAARTPRATTSAGDFPAAVR